MSEQELYSIDEMLSINWAKEKNTDKLMRSINKIDKSEINKKNANGDTLLHIATRISKQNIINLLIKKGADPDILNSTGETPRNLAPKQGVNEQMKVIFSEENITKIKNNPLKPKKMNRQQQQVIKKKAFEKDNYKCVICGTTNTFETIDNKQYMEGHHLIVDSWIEAFFDVNDFEQLTRIENIVTLCPMCHAKIHNDINNQKKCLEIAYNHLITHRSNWIEEQITLDELIYIYDVMTKKHKWSKGVQEVKEIREDYKLKNK